MTTSLNSETIRVLMIEDSPDDALLIIRTLKRDGCLIDFRRIETQQEMSEALREQAWDIILCDAELPNFSAPAAIAVLAQSDLAIPLIVVSGHTGEEQAAEYMRLGARDFVPKQNLSRLCPVIRRELAQADIRRGISQTDLFCEASANHYRLLLSAMQEGFALHEILYDKEANPTDYRFMAVNPVFEKLSGLAASDLIGKTLREAKPQALQLWLDAFEKVAWTGQPLTFEDFSTALNRFYHVQAFLPEKDRLAVLFSDITDIRNLQQQLLQAQKLESIGTLAGGIAHEFNNILGTIIGYAEMARENLSQGPPAADAIDEIFKAGERARQLIRQILTFMRNQEGPREPLLVVPLVKEIVKLLRSSIPATVRIEQHLAATDALIEADAVRIHQIIMNLCANAADAMKDRGGILTLGVDTLSITPENPAPSAFLPPGHYLELRVVDTGCGIDPRIRHQIFNPFFTTKKPGEGTGMGLAVVRGIVENYSGFLRLESEPGKGTAVFVYLPLAEAAKPATPQVPEEKLPTAGGNEKILLVDDETDLLRMVSGSLARRGYQVTALTSSVEALRLFQEDPSSFDLVITDQTMPDLSGAELAREMLSVRPGLPIILCTGYSTALTSKQASLMGIREYVMKPLIMRDFTQLVRKVLDESSSGHEKK